MSTTIINETDNLGFYLCRFYGGSERGTCYQITDKQGTYVQLTKAQITALVHRLISDEGLEVV